MKKAKKILALVLSALVLMSLTVVGTLAYLTSLTPTVTNTFTVGNVQITLDEAPVDANGAMISGDRVTENNYKLLPGHTYYKDPTVHVDDASEDCWLFVKVENEIAAIEDATTIAAQMTANGWTLVDGETNVYAHAYIANAGDDVVVFSSFKVKGNVTNAELATYAGKTVKITAYAVQADGFATAASAWENAKTEW